MILYKYVRFDDAIRILEEQTLAFSHLEDFNDPFECTGSGLYGLDVPLSVATNAFRNRFSRKYIILCLTRTALNPLMWSHYGDSYKGVVIGIDTKKAGFENIEQYIIPAQKGEIRYLRTSPKDINKANVDNLLSVGDANLLNWEVNEELLKHALLYKMQEWAYEEEVRIVKNISSVSAGYHYSSRKEFEINGQIWNRVQLPTRPIYSIKIPKEAFVDITLGLASYKELKRLQEVETQNFNPIKINKLEKLFELIRYMKISAYRTERNDDMWSLERKNINSIVY
ncbi:DUF2971 domain-containing protein [Acinetobacter vivianii]|uniref:DUF2971 domain-containing protein n=1 Tax=Acinetobacter vivianii TaxID=1776742 RepID=UPI002DBCE651|nr:DUF2971 domain-containing protein [Acinetobacter vivianii]MEB6481222.1 DUF2971 domain-containing protein [Acinetobacter vivianii]MEB6659584.1 DUF2971 domain-containing protein [Acinetobacter vivianii]